MNRRRASFALAGVFVVLATVVLSNTLNAVVATVVDVLGNDYIFVGIFGVLAFVIGLIVLAAGRSSKLHQAELPEPEEPVLAAAPGAEFDSLIGRWWIDVPYVGGRSRETVRTRVREATIHAIMRAEGCDRDRALAEIEQGTWTDDELAARFVNASEDGFGSVSVRVRALVTGETMFERKVGRTIDALSSLSTSTRSVNSTVGPNGKGAAVGSDRGSTRRPGKTDGRTAPTGHGITEAG